MADISITAANVKLVSGPTEQMAAGAAFTAGQLGYKEAATKKAKLSDNDNATAEVRSVYGIALHAAAIDQPITFAKNGAVVDLGGAVLAAGTDYYLSGTPGAICVRSDVVSTDDPVRVGMALTTSRLQLDINDPGVTALTTTSIGAGNVEIILDGEQVVLRPTLRAAQTISKQSGGIMSAVQAVANFDFDVITSVIALGLNVTGSVRVNEVAEKVYATGLVDLVEPVTKFLTVLANGGRSTDAKGGEEQQDPR